MAKKPNAYLERQDAVKQKYLDVGEELTEFYDRYPYVKKIDYSKPKKGWV